MSTSLSFRARVELAVEVAVEVAVVVADVLVVVVEAKKQGDPNLGIEKQGGEKENNGISKVGKINPRPHRFFVSPYIG